MRPLTDACLVSREKLAFIVDATAAPIASIVPISSWVGFEISLIQVGSAVLLQLFGSKLRMFSSPPPPIPHLPQTELNRILEQHPDTTSIKTTGFAIFLESIAYRYYCIFMVRQRVCRLLLLSFSNQLYPSSSSSRWSF